MSGVRLLVDGRTARQAQQTAFDTLRAYHGSSLLRAKLAHARLGWRHADNWQWIALGNEQPACEESTASKQPRHSRGGIAVFVECLRIGAAAWRVPFAP